MTQAATNIDGLSHAYRAARKIARENSGDFYFASFFLPKHKRRAVDSIAAFCSMIVEAIDLPEHTLAGARGMREHPVVQTPKAMSLEQLPAENVGADHGDACEGDTLDARLAMLRDRLGEIYENRLELPAIEGRSPQQHALVAVAKTVREFEIDRQLFAEFAEGCRVNVTKTRYENWSQLQDQIDRTAGAVGVMVNSILGATHSEARRLAIRLACAMRLTRVLGDLKRDLPRGRIYLPQDELRRFNVRESGIVPSAEFTSLVKFQIARARRMFREAAAGICWLADDGSRLAVAIATLNSVAQLDAIERDPASVLTRRVALTSAQKLLKIPAAVRLARRIDGQPLPKVL